MTKVSGKAQQSHATVFGGQRPQAFPRGIGTAVIDKKNFVVVTGRQRAGECGVQGVDVLRFI